jgi:hypothetical protein
MFIALYVHVGRRIECVLAGLFSLKMFAGRTRLAAKIEKAVT